MSEDVITQQLKSKGTEVLLQLLEGASKSFNQAIEFGKQEIPEVIRQLLLWEMASAGLWVIFSLATLIFIWCKWVPWINKQAKIDTGAFFGHVVTVFGSITTIVLVFVNLKIVLYIWIAPKVYLLEYAAELIKR